MKNKKEDTKLYKGIIGLAKTAAGMNCEYGDYQDIKQYFRYPGELLERMEEQGFTSISDYISVMKGLSRIGKYHTDGTFIGSQLEDFLKRAKEKAVKEQNLILLYQVLAFSYAHILRAYIADQKKLEEKAPILEEIFNQDVKEFLYQQVSYFTTDQIHLLFESGYLDFSEFMRINKKYSKEYLKKMDKPYLLTFLKTFCESRNWIFTDNEANFLENSFKDSWVIGLAYYKKQTVNYLSVFSEEEQEMLLGLMCELITRIPDICDLDDFMAGIISSTETRKILGAELSEQWYQFLEARSYKAMNSLRQDYLPEEVYAAFVQKKEKLEAEKKKIKEQEKLKEAKAALNDELNEISDTVEGNLYGHLYLGAIMVKEACRACMVNETSQNIQLLIHMILSHHGKMEYGAVKSPATREAYVLHILDELDSKLWVYEDVMKNTEPGTFSQPKRWLDGAVVYNSDVDLNSH